VGVKRLNVHGTQRRIHGVVERRREAGDPHRVAALRGVECRKEASSSRSSACGCSVSLVRMSATSKPAVSSASSGTGPPDAMGWEDSPMGAVPGRGDLDLRSSARWQRADVLSDGDRNVLYHSPQVL
jgi:hypothetical protein